MLCMHAGGPHGARRSAISRPLHPHSMHPRAALRDQGTLSGRGRTGAQSRRMLPRCERCGVAAAHMVPCMRPHTSFAFKPHGSPASLEVRDDADAAERSWLLNGRWPPPSSVARSAGHPLHACNTQHSGLPGLQCPSGGVPALDASHTGRPGFVPACLHACLQCMRSIDSYRADVNMTGGPMDMDAPSACMDARHDNLRRGI